jgi:hypothetical protein
MQAIIQELESRKSEIQTAVDLLFKANMKITDWDVPEADDKQAAEILLGYIQERIDEIRADVQAGKYDTY